jgi:hypothetical protein
MARKAMKAGAKAATTAPSRTAQRRARAASRPSRTVEAAEPKTFLEASLHDSPMILSAPETERMWEIQRASERDPKAFIEESRAKARRS